VVPLASMTNILSDDKKQQVLALGQLGWTLRRITCLVGLRRSLPRSATMERTLEQGWLLHELAVTDRVWPRARCQRFRHGQGPLTFGYRRGVVARHPELAQQERGGPHLSGPVAQALRQHSGLAHALQDRREVAERQQCVAKFQADLESLLERRAALRQRHQRRPGLLEKRHRLPIRTAFGRLTARLPEEDDGLVPDPGLAVVRSERRTVME